MTKYNPDNERIKRRYFSYLKEAEGCCEQTLDTVASALSRYEAYTKHRDFKAFHFQSAIAFKNHLAEQRNQRSGVALSKSTMHAVLTCLKKFFHWLAGQPGYKSRFQYSDANYFNLSEKDVRVATARREQKCPTIEQVLHVIDSMRANTPVEQRNRALIAFTLLTGARDSAIASMKLKHVDLVTGCVHQDARDVKTKFSKTFTTYFFPVGDEVHRIFSDWVKYLREELLWGNDDPLFPATRIAVGKTQQFEVAGLERKHWSTATPIRTIFQRAFADAGLPYFNPHSFRNALARLGEENCKTPEHFKAWSQNLGHEGVLTTFMSYGTVPSHRQGEIIRSLGEVNDQTSVGVAELAKALVRELQATGAGFNADH